MNKIAKRIGNPFEWIGLTVCQDCSLSELEDNNILCLTNT